MRALHTGLMADAPGTTAPTEVSTPGGHGRILSLEVVRGVAAAVVLLHHSLAAGLPAYDEWTRAFVDPGRIGVVMFFVVSGYVIPLSLDKQPLTAFVIRRLFRLFPLYWLVLVLYVLLDSTVRNGDYSSAVWVLNAVMVQGVLSIATIIPTAWTLGIEMAFYAQASVFSRYCRRIRADALGYAWLVLFALMMLAQGIAERPLPVTGPLLLFTAAIGHTFYLVQHREVPKIRLIRLVVCGLVVVPMTSALGGHADPNWGPFVYSASWIAGVLNFALVTTLGRVVRPRVATFLGNTSYGVYLLHPLVHNMFADRIDSVAILVTVTCVVTYLVAQVVHRGLEAPLISVGRRLTSDRLRSSAAAPLRRS